MIIIIDVNILLSALIKDSTTRALILTSGQEFYFPEKSMQKIRKYKQYIKEKSGLSDLEFLKLFHILMKFIKIIPDEDLLEEWDNAKRIMEHIDLEDVTFIAAALSQEEAIIWSDDRHFEKQNAVITLKTKDVIDLFNSG
ncbi:MAG: PIN domain-containing protein [Candidatus Woesearchaeota archaeon]